MNAGRAHRQVRDLPLHLVLTHDVVLGPGCVARLAAAVMGDPTVAIAGPALVARTDAHEDDAHEDDAHEDDELRVAAGRTVRCGGDVGRFGLVHHRSTVLTGAANTEIVDWIDGAVMMLRSISVGPFDERFFLYGEDVGACLAVRPTHRVVVVTDALAGQKSGAEMRPGVHGYLIVRNALLLDADRDVGRGTGSIRSMIMLSAQIKRLLVNEDPSRGYHARQLLGMAWGLVDGLRGTCGPPPNRLRQWGDVQR